MPIQLISQAESTHTYIRGRPVPTELKWSPLSTGVSPGGLTIEGLFAAAVGELVIAAEAVNLA